MVCIFHQNMQEFGGNNLPKNMALQNQFTAINGDLNAAVGASPLAGRGPIAVAGFTEVKNNRSAAGALSGSGGGFNLCGNLGTNFLACIKCGCTALTDDEFVGIGIRPGYNVLSAGRVFLHNDARTLIHDIAPTLVLPNWANWCNGEYIPPRSSKPLFDEAVADYRMVVYVIVQLPPNLPFAVGFLHNMYNLARQSKENKFVYLRRLPQIFNKIKENHQLNINSNIYIGGDFNIFPLRRRDRTGTICYPFWRYLSDQPLPPAVPVLLNGVAPPGMKSGGTTKFGNPHLLDYWYSTLGNGMEIYRLRGYPGYPEIPFPYPAGRPGGIVPPLPVEPIVDNRTLRFGASDHAAILLQIPP